MEFGIGQAKKQERCLQGKEQLIIYVLVNLELKGVISHYRL